MASELSAQTDAKELRHLFFKIGERFAKDTGDLFQGAQSLTQLEERLNALWPPRQVTQHKEFKHVQIRRRPVGLVPLPWA